MIAFFPMYRSPADRDLPPPAPRHPVADAAFRGLLSLIFIVAGTGHLINTGSIVHRLTEAPLGDLATALFPPTPLVVASGVALLAGGLALLVGFRTRLAALLLMAVLIPITVTVQISPSTLGPLFKNVGLFGGLLFFAVNGPGGYSVDGLRAAHGEPEGSASQPST